MPDEREIENRVERVPATPDRLLVLSDDSVTVGNPDAFEALWREWAMSRSQQSGCLFVRLHRDVDNPARFMTYDLSTSRPALIPPHRNPPDAPAYPLSGPPSHTFLPL